MGIFCSKSYQKLEFFAKSKSESGCVSVCDAAGHQHTFTMQHPYYNWFKMELEPEQNYEITLQDAEISMAYLSGNPDMMENGICYLEMNEGQITMLEGDRLSEFYNTPIREQYHFQPIKNWMNDPNGLCWYKGYYHMFYQANPHGQMWHNMYWGHAASKDLIHWVHLPFVLEPQEDILNRGDADIRCGAFSGSAVPTGDKVLFYLTRHMGPPQDGKGTVQYQTMAESSDMIHLEKEHVIIEEKPEGTGVDFRDPKVSVIDGTWYMVIGANKDGYPSMLLYVSEDGRNWSYLKPLLVEKSDKAITTFECPDFFPLDNQYVVMGAWMHHHDECGRYQMTRYYIGDFKEESFSVKHSGWLDFGSNFYASQSFEHAGRRIMIGWISDFYNEHVLYPNGVYGSMSIPRELHIKNGRLYMEPVAEIYELLEETIYRGSDSKRSFRIPGNSYYAKLELASDTDFEILLGKTEKSRIALQKKDGITELVVKGTKSENIRFVADVAEVTQVEIFVDRRVVEVFLNGGEAAGTKLFYNESCEGVFEISVGEKDAVEMMQIYTMRSIWNR